MSYISDISNQADKQYLADLYDYSDKLTGGRMNTLAGILIVIGFFILLAILFWGAVYTPKT